MALYYIRNHLHQCHQAWQFFIADDTSRFMDLIVVELLIPPTLEMQLRMLPTLGISTFHKCLQNCSPGRQLVVLVQKQSHRYAKWTNTDIRTSLLSIMILTQSDLVFKIPGGIVVLAYYDKRSSGPQTPSANRLISMLGIGKKQKRTQKYRS